MTDHASAAWRHYVAIFCTCSAVTLGAVATLNYRVDPYLIHQWNTPEVQRLQPGRERLSAWGKTYALARLRPRIVYIGNSRTELGLPTQTDVFGGQQAFNSALSGASLGDTIAMVRHAATVSRLDTVVWGIDAPSFSMEIGNTDFDRELVSSGSFYLWKRGLIDLKRALTMDMTMDSIRLLRGTFGHLCHSSLAYYGQRDEVCVWDRINGWGGTQAAILPRAREFVRGAGPTAEAFDALESTVATLCRAGTRLRLYINPTHAMMADVWYWAGRWASLESWETGLAAMAAQHRDDGCDVRVYDFSGFNSVTSEPVPQASGRRDMLNYWETSHYRVNVGHMILARMFASTASAIPADFGVELTPAALARHLQQLNADRERYHTEHPTETAMARAVAAASEKIPPSAVAQRIFRVLPTQKTTFMEQDDQRYLIQQNKISDGDQKPPVFAKVMRSKEGVFEGVSFIKSKEKASILTIEQANQAIEWAARKKPNAHEYVTKIICVGQ